ncbi:MAG: patatin-like phospholipase family protein [Hyphomicrobiaceae bacterium]
MRDTLSLDLALQGGGAHGAFTWGVLDRLLDESWLTCAAISGASAGAMNAVIIANGLLDGGRSAAQKALWSFWKRISRAAHGYRPAVSPFHALFLSGQLGLARSIGWAPWWSLPGQWSAIADAFTRKFSPYQFNPLNLNAFGPMPGKSLIFNDIMWCRRRELNPRPTHYEFTARPTSRGDLVANTFP